MSPNDRPCNTLKATNCQNCILNAIPTTQAETAIVAPDIKSFRLYLSVKKPHIKLDTMSGKLKNNPLT